MTKRIKHVSELPDWFQLEKYQDTVNLSAGGWLEQLWLRVHMHSFIETAKKEEIDNNDLSELSAAVALLQKNPIINMDCQEIGFHELFNPLCNEMHRVLSLAFGVRSITIGEFLLLEKDIGETRLENPRDALEEAYSDVEHPWRDVLDGPIDYLLDKESIHEKSIAHVNWDLPDTVLIEHFKEYLMKNRPHESTIKKSKLDFNSWHRFALLPYIDLKIWELTANKSITNRVFADALYPHGTYGEETVRKTTAQIAESIINGDEIINLLLAEAYCEKNGKL